MSSLRQPETLVRAWRPDRPNDPLIERAHRAASEDAVLRRRLEEQGKFDAQLMRAVQAILPPDGLRGRVTGSGAAGSQGRPPFALAAYVAAFCGVATVVVLVILFALERRNKFPGSEGLARVVASADGMTGLELEPVANSNKAGDLADWFYVRGFEMYTLPKELAGLPAAGSRLFKQEGTTVAQVAVEWHHAFLYLFRADAFGVNLPPGEWRTFEADNWQAAVRKDENRCTVVALRGHDAAEMSDVMRTLKQP